MREWRVLAWLWCSGFPVGEASKSLLYSRNMSDERMSVGRGGRKGVKTSKEVRFYKLTICRYAENVVAQ